MSVIEHRVEAVAGEQHDYSGREFTAEEIRSGVHREFVGGVWDTHGPRQLEYFRGLGLLPQHCLLDIGCGCFRAGRFFVDYLEPGHYYGIDANHSLMQAGYDVELTDAQRERLPVANLRANDRFDGDFGVKVDFALAQSVFTHVSLNHIRLCLHRTARVVAPGGSLYATFFEKPASTPVDAVFPSKRGTPFFTEKDVYWYYASDLRWAAQVGPWEYQYIGEWGHPAHQKMVRFLRLTDEEAARRKARAGSGLVPRARRFVRRGRRWAARRLDPR